MAAAALEALKKVLRKEDRIQIIRFGRSTVRRKHERVGRHPKNWPL
jgi:nucleoid DNA-binding protein